MIGTGTTVVGYVGQYRSAFFGLIPFGPTLNIYRKHDEVGDHLMAYVQGLPGVTLGELFPGSETTVFNPGLDDFSLSFKRNRMGKATRVLVHLNGQDLYGIRVSARPNHKHARNERNPALRHNKED